MAAGIGDIFSGVQQMMKTGQPQQSDQGQKLQAAVYEATLRYPWLRRMGVPIKLTIGKGPYMSESYMPNADENPHPGNFTVELRNKRLTDDPSQWASALGREGMDYMARADPTYQKIAEQFRGLMTPPQLKRARARYDADAGIRKSYTFDDFLKEAETQEYVGGYVFNMPGWENAGWTPQQRRLLDGLKQYMWQGQAPTPLNFTADAQRKKDDGE